MEEYPILQPIVVANYFIKKALAEGKELTTLKIIKLVHIAHGWYLGFTGEQLISEAVEAWKYGPVVPSLYHTFKRYGSNTITSLEHVNGSIILPVNERIIKLLDKIWEVYSDFTAVQLSTLTHEKATPWDEIWNEEGGSDFKGSIIPNNLIKEYYKKRIAENRSSSSK